MLRFLKLPLSIIRRCLECILKLSDAHRANNVRNIWLKEKKAILFNKIALKIISASLWVFVQPYKLNVEKKILCYTYNIWKYLVDYTL